MVEPVILMEPQFGLTPTGSQQRFALLQLGFRPFYVLASAFAAVSIATWAAQVAGWGWPYLPEPLWHAHEMVFGFALAVVVGFLFTAVRNWTGQRTPGGAALALLALLWLAGRVLVVTPWDIASAIARAAFPLACAVAIAIPWPGQAIAATTSSSRCWSPWPPRTSASALPSVAWLACHPAPACASRSTCC